MWYAHVKDTIGLYTGLERDALHIHAALALYIVAMAVFRQTRHSRVPWLVVFGLLAANEAYDLRINWVEGPEWAIAASVKDLWNTMLWPTVLLFVGRYTHWFQRRRDGAKAAPAPDRTA